ncbi:MAG: hypothetical protein OEY64_11675 [Nitrospinota bacterium]|nr:hypothetical protein [Nitrospinota bacterium]
MNRALIFTFILSGLLFTPASAEKQSYVEVYFNEQPELEKAWVVAPHVVITSPRGYPHTNDTRDGYFQGGQIWYFGVNMKYGIKAYISYSDLEVSEDIPPEVIEAYRKLKKVINRMGGIEKVIEDELETRMALV